MLRAARDLKYHVLYLPVDLIPFPAFCRGVQAGVWAGGRHVESGHDAVPTADRALPLVVSPLPAVFQAACQPSLQSCIAAGSRACLLHTTLLEAHLL